VKALRDLWAGRLPLYEVVWTWGVLRGALLNVGFTMVSLWILLVNNSPPVAAAAVGIHFLPVPYNIIFAVGAWRSAGQPQHSPRTRVVARVSAVVLCSLYMLI
jgi:hypothetical protein